MKKIFLLVVCYVATFQSFAQFTTVGSVIAYPGGAPTGYAMDSAPCSHSNVACAIWSTSKLNFYHTFDIVFYANFTVVNSPGADGICAVFSGNPSIVGTTNGGGGLIGYYDPPGGPYNSIYAGSLGIEYDIFQNPCSYDDPNPPSCYTPYTDHIMVAKNASFAANLTPPTQADFFVPNIKDGVFRKYRIHWDCAKDSLYTYCNDSLRTVCYVDPVATFGDVLNAQNIYWGFTSAVGYYCAVDTIKNITVTTTDSCVAPCFDTCKLTIEAIPAPTSPCSWIFIGHGICPTDGVIITLYDWNMGDGSGDFYTTSDTFYYSYAHSGTYMVSLKIIAYDTRTGQCCEETAFHKLRVACGPSMPARPETAQPKPNLKGMDVFPNPTSDELNIKATDFEMSSISIYNIQGQKLVEKVTNQSNSERIDIHNFVNGNYILEVTDKQGSIHRTKFVVQK